MEKSKRQRIVLYLVLIGGLALLVCYFDEILAFFGQVGGVSLPLVLGCGIAYVLNIIMSAMERHYFTKKDAPWVAKTRRPVCLAASIHLFVSGDFFCHVSGGGSVVIDGGVARRV